MEFKVETKIYAAGSRGAVPPLVGTKIYAAGNMGVRCGKQEAVPPSGFLCMVQNICSTDIQ